jgi:hypothetical protein
MPISGKALVLLALAGALPAAAQDTWQLGLGLNLLQAVEIGNLAGSNRIRRENQAGAAVSVGRLLWDFGPSDLFLTGEYQAWTRYEVIATGSLGDFAFRETFLAPGLQWTWHGAADAGLGLQGRFQRLRGSVQGLGASTTCTRAWVNGYLGCTFPGRGAVSTFVGLRGAVALGRTRPPGSLAGEEDLRTLLRSLAGDAEAALQAGIRF